MGDGFEQNQDTLGTDGEQTSNTAVDTPAQFL
jgi:hypothetical protein